MSTRRRIRRLRNVCVIGLFAASLLPASSLYAQEEEPLSAIDIRVMAKGADFIFKGTVDKVNFRNSEFVQAKDPTTGAPVVDPDGEPIWEDGSNLPHSFVTYRIEQIYKGKPPAGQPGEPPSSEVVLRFAGGLCMDDSNDVVFAPDYPHMDQGDQDVLFVQDNTVRSCPLAHWATGRFRVLVDPNDLIPKMYNDAGHEVLHVGGVGGLPDEAALGPWHHFPEVTTYHFGDCAGCAIEVNIVDPPDEFSLPGQDDEPEQGVPKGPQFTESECETFLVLIVQETHTQRELDALPPVVSANISRPFYAEPYTPAEPNDYGPEVPIVYPRPWLDELPEEERNAILEAERIEAYLMDLTRGNPVLPSTPCGMRILEEGPVPGDISGPQGKPDCRVNFFDFQVVAEYWLECYDPEDAACQ